MSSSAKSLAIQYAQAKRQAQNPMAAEDSKSTLLEAENSNNNNNNNISAMASDSSNNGDINASVSLQLPSPSQSPCESPSQSPDIASSGNPASNGVSNNNSMINTQQQATFNKIASNYNRSQSRVSNSKSVNRPKSTSMTNLVMDQQQQRPHSQSRSPSRTQNNNTSNNNARNNMQRPASRSALDNIHRGMNAKYAGVQSKVLLQNIRPQANANANSNTSTQRRAGSTLGRNSATPSSHRMASSSTGNLAGGERAQLMAKLKTLQEQLEQAEADCEALRQEGEREKRSRNEQLGQLKQELQEKLAEHERQNEDHHQKLMEAYELADQNRRAADTVLSESRQRDEEAKKKVEELEGQLAELKEFVLMKEEMNGKLYELREQLREERERYEEQLKSLHNVFDNEKISAHQIANGNQQESKTLRSNYFARPRNQNKEFVNSTDSIQVDRVHGMGQQQQGRETLASPSVGCSKCRTGASKLHKSEYDLVYGSRLSTRMQTGAKSAWRSTKKLASSMVTSGVSLTACRHKSASASMRGKKNKNARNQATSEPGCQSPSLGAHQQQAQQEQQQQASLSGQYEELYEQSFNNNNQEQQQEQATYLTSVIKLEASNNAEAAANQQQDQGQIKSTNQASSFIHKDQNNHKLTIVTTYSKQDQPANNKQSGSLQDEQVEEAASGSSGPASASGGERSRCESASSGRGTSEDERESAASIQNGPLQVTATTNGEARGDGELVSVNVNGEGDSNKRHKRRSSTVFKASQLLPMKTASSLKSQFKSLFTMTPPQPPIQINHQQAQDPTRIRMEQPETLATPTTPFATEIRVSQPESLARTMPETPDEPRDRQSGVHGIAGDSRNQITSS